MVAISTHHPVSRPSLRLVPPPRRSPAYGLRRLLALLAVSVLLALAADAAFGALSATPQGAARSAGADPAAASAEVYLVQPGDTLWSIAAEIAPESDPRAVVDDLIDRNGIARNGSASLQIGQRLVLD